MTRPLRLFFSASVLARLAGFAAGDSSADSSFFRFVYARFLAGVAFAAAGSGFAGDVSPSAGLSADGSSSGSSASRGSGLLENVAKDYIIFLLRGPFLTSPLGANFDQIS
jgi:hypothetical protein